MGLIKAIKGAVGSVAADQWKEYFYCDALDNEVLASKGRKRVSGRGSNTKGDDNIITNGSVVAVNEGQCMIIVDQGKVVEFCAEAGEFVYDTSSEPSLFYGSFGESLADTFEAIGKRFTFGGDAAKDQRVYFFNTKEIMGNKYGTASPVPFRVVDANIGLDIDITLRCNGQYSYKITDPLLFYKNVCGNIPGDFMRSEIEGQLRTELLTALQPAFARISELGVRYSSIPKHTTELMEILNEELSAKWSGLRGISIVSFGMNSVKAPEEDEAMIKELQRTAVYRNPNMAAATLVNAQADADEGGGVHADVEGHVPGGTAKDHGQVFREDVLPRGLAAGEQQVFAAQQGRQGVFPNLPAIVAEPGRRDPALQSVLQGVGFPKLFHFPQQRGADAVFLQK